MSDEIRITGEVNLVEVVATLNYAVKEMARIGEVVEDEGKENRKRFDAIKAEVNQCRTELMKEISALDKEQVITAKDVRTLSAKVAAGVSVVAAVALWILKSGVVAAFL